MPISSSQSDYGLLKNGYTCSSFAIKHVRPTERDSQPEEGEAKGQGPPYIRRRPSELAAAVGSVQPDDLFEVLTIIIDVRGCLWANGAYAQHPHHRDTSTWARCDCACACPGGILHQKMLGAGGGSVRRQVHKPPPTKAMSCSWQGRHPSQPQREGRY